jgi:hypothetical protein
MVVLVVVVVFFVARLNMAQVLIFHAGIVKRRVLGSCRYQSQGGRLAVCPL